MIFLPLSYFNDDIAVFSNDDRLSSILLIEPIAVVRDPFLSP
jgi:hypothetical protein